MPDVIDVRELGTLIKAKRGPLGLRAAAKEIGEVSPSTLSRVEQGQIPDLDTYVRICQWLGVSPEKFVSASKQRESPDTPDIIAAHLRADRTLDPKTADALATMVRLAYQSAPRGGLRSKRSSPRRV
jgi:transcriptional regulator with XRE-family HTH domain